MAYKWGVLNIPRFYGLDLKTNPVDVKDGYALSAKNVFQDQNGVVSKKKGTRPIFASDEDANIPIDEIGVCTLGGTKYWFKFADGDFKYSTTESGVLTILSPAPAISTTNQIWWAVINDLLYFVDGTSALRAFDGTNIVTPMIPERPTSAPAVMNPGGFDFTYTLDNGFGESPARTVIVSGGSTNTLTFTNPLVPDPFIDGTIIRVYSRPTGIAAASFLVGQTTATATDVTNGFVTVSVTAATEDAAQLYTELGEAINATAPTGLEGIVVHYGRLIGWFDDTVYCSKITNANSFPTSDAINEAFVYEFQPGDGESITTCVSYRESLFVMKPKSVAIFVGVGPDDTGGNPFAFRRLEVNGNGCIGGKSAVVVGEEDRTYLVYLASSGFFATDGNSPVKLGEKIEPEIRELSTTSKTSACAIHEREFGVYICFVGPSTDRLAYVLDVRKDENGLVGWFKWEDMNIKCLAWDEDHYIAGTFEGMGVAERNTGSSSDLSDAAIEYIAPTDIDTTTEEISTTAVYATGDDVVVRSTGTMPAPLVANTTYFVIRIDASTIQLATSSINAQAGTPIDITTQGTGVHSIIRRIPIDGVYSTNWLRFGTTGNVKKLLKPTFIFNSAVSLINIDVAMAYDWTDAFVDELNITIASTHLWGVTDGWGEFVWGAGAIASPKNLAIPRRKVRSIRYRFRNSTIDQDLNLQGFQQEYALIRNRGNYAL